MKVKSSNSHNEFYSLAKYYDIAFQYINAESESSFFEEILRKHSPHLKSKTFIEFAAGPALNCIEMAKHGWNSTAVDLSPDMQTYGLEKANQQGQKINYLCSDMIRFSSEDKYDLAAILSDSTSYLLTNDDVINHLRSVADCLNDGGLYILEMAHPKDVFGVAKLTATKWEAERDGCKVKIKWGSDSDVFDPVSQITNVTVTLDYFDNDKSGTITNTSPQRCFTATEFEALVRASGVFEIAAVYGDIVSAMEFNNEKRAWRMVPVLRKK